MSEMATSTKPATGNPESSGKNTQLMVMIMLALSGILFYWTGMAAKDQNPQDVLVRGSKIKRNDEADSRCFAICQARRKMRHDQFGGDLLDSSQLYQMALGANAKMISKMKVDYGPDNFSNIFLGKDPASNETKYRGIVPITPTGVSMNRFKRKIRMKIMSAQVELRNKEKDFVGCDCINGDKALGASVGNVTEIKGVEKTFAKYIWATGGHSAAAGHGNLFNESYTAFLTRAVEDVFGSIGIEFVGRNYAMGGTGSGSEIALCSHAVFGTDIDFLSWDYGMTDGRADIKMLTYFYRAAGLNPGRPAILGKGLGGRTGGARTARTVEMEELGLAAFKASETEMGLMYGAIPDTGALGLTEIQISQMPELVRDFRCFGAIENGEPHCRKYKYNEHVCPNRKGKASWHPGVKSHALDGNIMALFLTSVLLEVLQDLSSLAVSDPEKMLAELKVEEDLLYADFMKADLPASAKKINGGTDTDIDFELLFRGPNICKTALTPAQTRYLGILMDAPDKVGGPVPLGKETYEVGISQADANTQPAEGKLRLAYSPGDRAPCHVTLKPDYKDFFYAHGKDGWVSLTIPNNAEKEAYGYDPAVFKGMIVIFESVCDWGKCNPNDLRSQTDFIAGNFEVEVNGKRVTSLSGIGHGGNVLKGEDGLYWKPNEEGAYELRVRVTQPKSFLRLGSIVLY